MSLDTITRVDGQVAVTVTGADVDADDGEMPSRIGRFFIFRQLGEGGMGRVFLGYDEELDRKLAIKLWHSARDHTMRVRVLREAQALARLSHPNVITVYDLDDVLRYALASSILEIMASETYSDPACAGSIMDRF